MMVLLTKVGNLGNNNNNKPKEQKARSEEKGMSMWDINGYQVKMSSEKVTKSSQLRCGRKIYLEVLLYYIGRLSFVSGYYSTEKVCRG